MCGLWGSAEIAGGVEPHRSIPIAKLMRSANRCQQTNPCAGEFEGAAMRARRVPRRKKRIKTAHRPSTGGLGEATEIALRFPQRAFQSRQPPPDPGSTY